jgi:(E)-4-hydroxy-3-methylbut-2-enyl-diphosphate synthase
MVGGPSPLVVANVTKTPSRDLAALLAGGKQHATRPDLLLVDLSTMSAGAGVDRLRTVRSMAPAGTPVAIVASVAVVGDGARFPRPYRNLSVAGIDCLRVVLPGAGYPDAVVALARIVDEVQRAGVPLWLHAVEPESPPTDGRPAWEAAVDALLAAHKMLTAAGGRGAMLSVVCVDHSSAIRAYRLLAARLALAGDATALALHVRSTWTDAGPDGLPLDAPIALGSLLADGIGDSVLLEAVGDVAGADAPAEVALAFDCLQAVGARAFKVDLVACPSCGRTLFDLQTTAERIQRRVAHLVGVKIAVMGCVVNGPGELADADFGYMGGAPGRVNLYVGRECVERNVPAEDADDRLVALIKAHGRWVEPA